MANGSIVFKIFLRGRFRVESANGHELKVSSAKAQGLLALLATEDGMARSRVWLQDKLWSDRQPEHGSGSLRQVLAQLRKAFGKHADVLCTDRRLVGLDRTRVEIDRAGSGEFLEGIDIRDQEFEAWLTQMRSHGSSVETDPPIHRGMTSFRRFNQTARRALVVEYISETGSALGSIEMRFGDMLHRSLRELVDFEPRQRAQAAPSVGTMTLTVHAFDGGEGRLGIRIALYQGLGESPNWADSAIEQFGDAASDFGLAHLNLCHRAGEALSELLTRPLRDEAEKVDANALAGSGLRKMFSMRREGFEEAGRLFDTAYELRPRGLYLAWRAQLAVIDFMA